jgi:hypothetical protein
VGAKLECRRAKTDADQDAMFKPSCKLLLVEFVEPALGAHSDVDRLSIAKVDVAGSTGHVWCLTG